MGLYRTIAKVAGDSGQKIANPPPPTTRALNAHALYNVVTPVGSIKLG